MTAPANNITAEQERLFRRRPGRRDRDIFDRIGLELNRQQNRSS